MPEMPAFLANALEPRFARRTQVTDVVDAAPLLRRVRLEGESLRGVSFRPGQEVEFRVSDRAFRHYTPARFDAVRGSMDIVFFLHGEGPGTAWAKKLQVGQQVNVLGPGGRFALQEEFTTHVLLGDETTLGLFVSLSEAVQGRVLGAIETGMSEGAHGEPGRRTWPSLVGVELPVLERGPAARGESLVKWLDANPLSPRDPVCFYLAGHAGSIVRVRDHLLRQGWSRRSIRTKPYWADGKKGL